MIAAWFGDVICHSPAENCHQIADDLRSYKYQPGKIFKLFIMRNAIQGNLRWSTVKQAKMKWIEFRRPSSQIVYVRHSWSRHNLSQTSIITNSNVKHKKNNAPHTSSWSLNIKYYVGGEFSGNESERLSVALGSREGQRHRWSAIMRATIAWIIHPSRKERLVAA